MSQDNQKTEKASSPSIGRMAVPVWILMVGLLLGYRGCIYVDSSSAGMSFSSDIYGPYHSQQEIEQLLPKSGDEDWIRKGKNVYGTYCAACHQTGGGGSPGQFPPLANSDWVIAEGPNRIIRIALYGVAGPITVSGQPFNSQMPPFGSPTMSDDQVAQVVSYIRNSKDWGHPEVGIVTAEQVTAIREAEGERPQWKAADLLGIPLN